MKQKLSAAVQMVARRNKKYGKDWLVTNARKAGLAAIKKSVRGKNGQFIRKLDKVS